jgi:hypothetical protein
MPLHVGDLYGTLDLDVKPFEKKLASATKGGEKDLLTGLNNLGRQAAFGFGLGFAGFKLQGLFRDTISEARDAEHATKLTEAVLRSTGGAANVTAGQVDKLANSLSKVAGVDDELISNGERVLLTFTRVRNEAGKGNDIFDRGVKAALDMSVAMGTDLQSSIVAVGKALQEPATGALALSRNGSLMRSDLKRLQEMMKDGTPLIEQQRFVLEALAKQYGGAAAAGADAGAKLDTSLKNLKESVGTALLPEVDALDKGVGFLADGFTALPGPMQVTVATLATVGTAAVAGTIALNKLSQALEGTALASAASKAEGKLVDLVPVLGLAETGQVGLAIAGLAALTVGVVGLSHKVEDLFDGEPKIREVTSALLDLANGKGGFDAVDEAARRSQKSIKEWIDKANAPGGQGFRAGVENRTRDIDAALATIVKSGHADAARRALDEFAKGADVTPKQLLPFLGKYRDAVADAGLQQKLANESMDRGSDAAAKLTDRMDKLAAAERKREEAASAQHLGGLIAMLQAEQAVTGAESSLSDAIKGTGDEAASSSQKMKTYADAVSQVFDSVLAADRAHTAASQSIRKLTDTNKEFTGDAIARLNGLIRIDGKQVATQDDLHSALLDVIEAREREVDAMAASGEIANTAQARHQALVDSLLDLRNEYPGLAGDIDRYIDAAKKIPELPLEAAIDKVVKKQTDLKGVTLDVITALNDQAGGEHATVAGLESMNTQLDALIKKYKDFPAAKDAFSQALAASIAQEAQILAGQMSLPADLIAGILDLPAGDRTTAFAGLFGLSYDPPGRAGGAPLAPGSPYLCDAVVTPAACPMRTIEGVSDAAADDWALFELDMFDALPVPA